MCLIGKAIRGLYIRVVLMGVIVALGLETVVLWVGTLYVNRISLRVSLVDLFRKCSRLLMEVILVLVISFVK